MQKYGYGFGAALLAVAPHASALNGGTFTLIAQDFVDGLEFIDGTVTPALDDTGRVAFAGTVLGGPMPGPQAIFQGNGGALTAIPTQANGYTGIDVVQIAGNDIAFAASRPFDDMDPMTPVDDFYGVYGTDLSGSSITTVFEQLDDPFPMVGTQPPPRPYLRMSGNGTLAFSNIVNGDGGIYTGTVGGGVSVLKTGSGSFFNTLALDINNSGAVAINIEYSDPNAGLQRSLMVFDTPEEGLAGVETTLERDFFQARFALSDTGEMAMVLPSDLTINYFDTPLTTSTNPPIESVTIEAGVYRATPNGFGIPLTELEQIASYADGFTSFGDVDINADGTIVFEAGYDGEFGIFEGGDPVADCLLITGEDLMIAGESRFFSFINMGQLNNLGQLAIHTSDFNDTDQRIYVLNSVGVIPEPVSGAIFVVSGALWMARRRRSR